MIEPHDHDKLKQEEADEQRQHEENELFKVIEPYIKGINNSIKVFAHFNHRMSKEECAEYVRDTLANLIQG